MKTFLLFLVNKIINSVIGKGFFCGFMFAYKAGVLSYSLVVHSFLWEDGRGRVAAMAGFVTGQFIVFTSVYNKGLHTQLFQLHRIILFFGAFFLLQLLWTSLTTFRNWKFLYPNDKKKRWVRRLVLLQLQFMLSFVFQLQFAYPEFYSMIGPLKDSYLKDQSKNLLFVISHFSGSLIGYISFMIFYLWAYSWLCHLYITNNNGCPNPEDWGI